MPFLIALGPQGAPGQPASFACTQSVGPLLQHLCRAGVHRSAFVLLAGWRRKVVERHSGALTAARANDTHAIQIDLTSCNGTLLATQRLPRWLTSPIPLSRLTSR